MGNLRIKTTSMNSEFDVESEGNIGRWDYGENSQYI